MAESDTPALDFDAMVRALFAPLVAELREFGVPVADTDPLGGVRLLIARVRELEAGRDG